MKVWVVFDKENGDLVGIFLNEHRAEYCADIHFKSTGHDCTFQLNPVL